MFTLKKKTLGEKLREIRTCNGLILKDMAARLGVSNGFLSEVERDLKMPGGEFFISLKREFGASIDALLGDEAESTDGATIVKEHEADPYISSVAEMMRHMDDDTKKDIQRSVEKEKLLRDLMNERQDKKANES